MSRRTNYNGEKSSNGFGSNYGTDYNSSYDTDFGSNFSGSSNVDSNFRTNYRTSPQQGSAHYATPYKKSAPASRREASTGTTRPVRTKAPARPKPAARKKTPVRTSTPAPRVPTTPLPSPPAAAPSQPTPSWSLTYTSNYLDVLHLTATESTRLDLNISRAVTSPFAQKYWASIPQEKWQLVYDRIWVFIQRRLGEVKMLGYPYRIPDFME
jgi:hypothetical protein